MRNFGMIFVAVATASLLWAGGAGAMRHNWDKWHKDWDHVAPKLGVAAAGDALPRAVPRDPAGCRDASDGWPKVRIGLPGYPFRVEVLVEDPDEREWVRAGESVAQIVVMIPGPWTVSDLSPPTATVSTKKSKRGTEFTTIVASFRSMKWAATRSLTYSIRPADGPTAPGVDVIRASDRRGNWGCGILVPVAD